MRYLQLSTSEYNPSLKKRRSLYPKLKVSSAGCQAHLAENDLWSQIFWGATQCPGPALHTFGKAKICNLRGDKEQWQRQWVKKKEKKNSNRLSNTTWKAARKRGTKNSRIKGNCHQLLCNSSPLEGGTPAHRDDSRVKNTFVRLTNLTLKINVLISVELYVA